MRDIHIFDKIIFKIQGMTHNSIEVTLGMVTFKIGHFDSWIEWWVERRSFYCLASQLVYMLHIFVCDVYVYVTDRDTKKPSREKHR